jgi:putative transposase
VAKLCKVLGVSRSGYYAWDKRPRSARTQENQLITEQIKEIHKKKRRTYGCRKITQELRRSGQLNVAEIHWKLPKTGNFKFTASKKHVVDNR